MIKQVWCHLAVPYIVCQMHYMQSMTSQLRGIQARPGACSPQQNLITDTQRYVILSDGILDIKLYGMNHTQEINNSLNLYSFARNL